MLAFVVTASATPTYLDSETHFRIPVDVRPVDVRRQVRTLRRQSGQTLYWRGTTTAAVLPRGEDAPAFAKLGEAAHLAWLVALDLELEPNIEWDFVVRPAFEGPTPVTVWTDHNRDIIVAVGSELPQLPKSDWPTLTERFGLSPVEESDRLDPELLGAIQLAYEALDPAVAHALRNVSFARRSEPTDRQGLPPDREPGARYLGSLHQIVVYDKAVQRTTRFVGALERPHHPLVSLLLHELGHALTHLPVVEAETPADLVDVPELGGLAAAFDAAIGGAAFAPTEYGRTQPSEAFADAFALYHLDPAALERACPAGAQWFRGADVGGASAVAAAASASCSARAIHSAGVSRLIPPSVPEARSRSSPFAVRSRSITPPLRSQPRLRPIASSRAASPFGSSSSL